MLQETPDLRSELSVTLVGVDEFPHCRPCCCSYSGCYLILPPAKLSTSKNQNATMMLHVAHTSNDWNDCLMIKKIWTARVWTDWSCEAFEAAQGLQPAELEAQVARQRSKMQTVYQSAGITERHTETIATNSRDTVNLAMQCETVAQLYMACSWLIWMLFNIFWMLTICCFQKSGSTGALQASDVIDGCCGCRGEFQGLVIPALSLLSITALVSWHSCQSCHLVWCHNLVIQQVGGKCVGVSPLSPISG